MDYCSREAVSIDSCSAFVRAGYDSRYVVRRVPGRSGSALRESAVRAFRMNMPWHTNAQVLRFARLRVCAPFRCVACQQRAAPPFPPFKNARLPLSLCPRLILSRFDDYRMNAPVVICMMPHHVSSQVKVAGRGLCYNQGGRVPPRARQVIEGGEG